MACVWPRNLVFRTSTKPTFVSSLPWISRLKAFNLSGGSNSRGLPSLVLPFDLIRDCVGGCVVDNGDALRVSEAELKNDWAGFVTVWLKFKDVFLTLLRGMRGGSIDVDRGASQ